MSDTPPVSIDEAIELFLAIAFPGGVPEGADREALVAKLRERIAADRPEWAAASAPSPAAAPPSPAAGYAQIKAAAIERARQAEIPSDPEERYLEQRRQEARRNRERREEEAEEAAARQRLIRNMLAEKEAAGAGQAAALHLARSQTGGPEVLPPDIDEETLERALRIRKLVVERLGRLRSGDVGAPSDEPRPPAPPPSSWREVAEVARDLSPDEQVRVVRGFNESKRALLKKREDLLVERRPRREDLLAERRPRRKDLLAERRSKRESLLAERQPKREQPREPKAAEQTGDVEPTGLRIGDPAVQARDSRRRQGLRVE